MTAPIRLALVGHGRMGRNWARVISQNARFALVLVVDPAMPADAHALCLPDLGRFPSSGIDGVIVASPTSCHAEDLSDLIPWDIPILAEKPLAATSAAALAFRGVPHVVVGHVERFNPAVRAALDVLASGILGDPIHAVATRIGGYPANPSGDVVLDLAVHDLDVLRIALGPLRVEDAACHATRGRCDTAEIHLASERGATATVHVDWIAPSKERTLRVTCTRGALFVDYVAQSGVIVRADGNRDTLPVEKAEPLAMQLDAFGDFIETGAPGRLATAADGAAAVVLAERAVVMGRKGWV